MSTTFHPFRFGAVTTGANSGAEWKSTAARLEAAGYSSLLLPDTPGPVLAPFAALATAAAATSTLRVGNWVLANDFRNPVLVAREAATLDLLSDGRLELGFGAGRADNDYASLGLEPSGSGGQRLRRLAESLHVIGALFRGETVTFDGEYYKIANATLYPPPSRQLPILIAASGPKALELAGQHADIVAIGSYSRELFEQQRQSLAAAAGQRFEGIELASLVFVVPEGNDSIAEATAAMAQRLGGNLDAMIANKAPNVVVGSHQAIVEQLQEVRSTLGLSYIVVGMQAVEWLAPVVQRLTGT